MNEKLRARIKKTVSEIASAKVVKAILKTIDKDLVLPILSLTARSRVRVETDESYIYLYVGCRDFQFYVKSGRLMGCGTYLGS